MLEVKIIDLHFQKLEHTIAAYLFPTSDGLVLVETGPYSTFPQLKVGIKQLGYKIEDVKHIFLTHIHLDHAGAAWAFAKIGARIYLHPFGAGNMKDPSRLMSSAKRIYQDRMDELWGRMEPISEDQLMEVANNETITIGGTEIKSLHTPGHAKHHIAWQVEDIIFTGDVAGVKINNGPVVPPCPPPDINFEDWKNSIQSLQNKKPKALYLTHYNKIENVEAHLNNLITILDNWSMWIKDKMDKGLTNEEMTPLFIQRTANQLKYAGVNETTSQLYEVANPSWMSVAGIERYWTKKGG